MGRVEGTDHGSYACQIQIQMIIQKTNPAMKHLFVYFGLLLVILMPGVSPAQVATPPDNYWEIFAMDSDLLVQVEILSLPKQSFRVLFKNVGTQVLLVPGGDGLHFDLSVSDFDRKGTFRLQLLLFGGMDAPEFKHLDTLDVSTLKPGESIAYSYEEQCKKEYLAIPHVRFLHLAIGYKVHTGDDPPARMPFSEFLQSQRVFTVIQHGAYISGEEKQTTAVKQRRPGDYKIKFPQTLGYYGDLRKWLTE